VISFLNCVLVTLSVNDDNHDDLLLKQVMRKHSSEFHDGAVQFAQESIVSAMAFMAPVFELPLSDVTVNDGQRAILECRVIGTPRPRVTWYVDGQKIEKTEYIEMTYEDGRCTLVIFDTMMSDEGEYTVQAVNDAGTCITTAYLSVLCMLLLISF